MFKRIRAEFIAFAEPLAIEDLSFVPVSALKGDNVVERSKNMPWYPGDPLLKLLEEVHVAPDWEIHDCRFPVQYVIRPMADEYHDYRGYAGVVAGGVFKPGDPVVVLPSGRTSRVASIDLFDSPVPEAFPHMSVTMRLEDDIDISRGSMISSVEHQPIASQEIDATICWMSEMRPLRPGDKFAIKHTTRTARALVKEITYRLDVNSHEEHPHPGHLDLNELGRIKLKTTVPLYFDPYTRNRTTGSFILIDEATNSTVGGGMIQGPA